MSEPGPRAAAPPVLARAEHATRRTMLLATGGFVAFVSGSIGTAVLVGFVEPLVNALASDAVILVTTTFIQAVWVVVSLPIVAWAIGRYFVVSRTRFLVVAGGTGLLFDVFLTVATLGVEWIAVDVAEAIARLAWVAVGFALSAGALSRGSASAERAQLRAKAQSSANAAQYQAYVGQQTKDKPE